MVFGCFGVLTQIAGHIAETVLVETFLIYLINHILGLEALFLAAFILFEREERLSFGVGRLLKAVFIVKVVFKVCVGRSQTFLPVVNIVLIRAQIIFCFAVFFIIPAGLTTQIEAAVKLVTELGAGSGNVLGSLKEISLGVGHI